MFIDRDENDRIVGRYAVRQRPDQEEVADDAAELQMLEAAAARRLAVDAAYMARVAAGVVHEGHAYQIDPESRGNIASRATRAGLFLGGIEGVTWPEDGMPFRTKANVWLTFTPQAFLTLAQAVDDAFTAMRVRYAALKTDVAAATTVEQLAAIEVDAGWD